MSTTVNGAAVRPGHPCPHSSGAGCAIYSARPEYPCRKFLCGWLRDDSPLPEWMRPSECGAIVFIWYDWRGDKVINAVPVGEKIPQRTLDWLKSYAQQQGRPLLFVERIKTGDSYAGVRCFGFGPPGFREKVEELRLQGEYAELIQMYTHLEAQAG